MFVVILLALVATRVHSFFDYKVDCIKECQTEKLPCTIRELSPRHFPCDCYNTDDACLSKASPDIVCLRPNGDPTGGTKIWPDYYNYTHPPTPNPPAPHSTPDPALDNVFLKIYAAVVSTILLLYGGGSLVRCVAETIRRRRYQQLLEERPQAPSSGTPASPESPYSRA